MAMAARIANDASTPTPATQRRCGHCQLVKPLDAFWRGQTWCKACVLAPVPKQAPAGNENRNEREVRTMVTATSMTPATAGAKQTATCTGCGQDKPLSAFSGHRNRPGWHNPRCNACVSAVLPHGSSPVRVKPVVPPGMKHCPGCNEIKPLDAFYANRSKRDGKQDHCKPCMADEQWKHRHPNTVHVQKQHAPAQLCGVRIHAGEAVDLSRAASAPVEHSVAPTVPAAPDMAPAAPQVRAGAITCRQWVREAGAGRRRLFLCAGGRVAVEQMGAEPGQRPLFLLWHLAGEYRRAELAPCDGATAIMLLSVLAPDALDAGGAIFSA